MIINVSLRFRLSNLDVLLQCISFMFPEATAVNAYEKQTGISGDHRMTRYIAGRVL